MPGIFRVAVGAVIEKNGKILLVRRSAERDHAPNEWEDINGRVEPGETFEAALKREVKEETDLEIEIVKPFYTFHFYRGPEKVEHLGVSFWCRYLAGEVNIDPCEHSEFKWVTIRDALNLVSDVSIKMALTIFEEIAYGK